MEQADAASRADGLVEPRESLEARRLRALVLAWAAVALVCLAGLAAMAGGYRLAAVEWARALAAMEERAEVAEAACGLAPKR